MQRKQAILSTYIIKKSFKIKCFRYGPDVINPLIFLHSLKIDIEITQFRCILVTTLIFGMMG